MHENNLSSPWLNAKLLKCSTILSIEFSTSFSSRGSKINDTTGRFTLYVFSMALIFSGVLFADFSQK